MIEKNNENDEDEILSRLACIEREIEKRAAYPINNYNKGEKIHEKQLAFHKCL